MEFDFTMNPGSPDVNAKSERLPLARLNGHDALGAGVGYR